MISTQLYWVMSDSEFTLDINNPEEPKILCVGNNPDRQNIYEMCIRDRQGSPQVAQPGV